MPVTHATVKHAASAPGRMPNANPTIMLTTATTSGATMTDRDAEIAEALATEYDLEHGAQLIQAGSIADRVDDAITAKLREWMHGNDIIV